MRQVSSKEVDTSLEDLLKVWVQCVPEGLFPQDVAKREREQNAEGRAVNICGRCVATVGFPRTLESREQECGRWC